MAFDLEIATITIYCEASNCTQEERIAVANVLWNRVIAKKWQPTVAGVCLQKMQFSEWNADPVNNKNLLRAANLDEDDPVLQDCRSAFLSCVMVMGVRHDPTLGACYYHDKSITPPSWTQGMTKTLETEHFIFYKD